MEGRHLAVELCPWLDIDTVLTVGRTHELHPERADEDDLLILHHPEIDSGSEGDIVGIVTEYLQNFHLPKRWLSSVFGMGPGLLEIDTWRWFHELRFKGEIEVDVDVTEHPFPVSVAHVLIRDSWAVTEILQRPLQMLFGSAVACLRNWQSVLDKVPPENFFLRARDDGPLVIHIDGHIAAALGVPSPKAAGRVTGGLNLSYRSVTAIETFDSLSRQPQLLEVAGEGLNDMASRLRE